MIQKEKKTQVILENATHEGDTGSPEVQIAILTARINELTEQRFKDGKLLTPAPLGYDRQKDVTGRYIKYAPLIVNESEAKIVVFIYDAYLTGWSMEQIALFLKDIGV